MKMLLYSIPFLVLSAVLSSCNKNPIPPEQQPQISLSLEDVSCTEAWLKLTTSNISLPADVELLKDDIHSETISLTSADTILYVDSLLPNKTYNFTSLIHTPDGAIKNSIPVTTMDTTSHNFTFQTWTFGGQAGSCTLYDVAIINENDIWAVGEIYLLDTLGQPDPLPFNAAQWNGSSWSIKRIQTNFRGNLVTVPLTGIYAFSSTDIWLVGSLPIHGDGQNWVMYDLRTTVDPNLTLAKAWGKITNDMYFVGSSGSIAHYQNGQWSKIESGTELNINDIYGAYNNGTDEWEILAVAADYGVNFDKAILKLKNNEVIRLTTTSNSDMEPLLGVWFMPGRQYYVVGSGIYQKHFMDDIIWKNNFFAITTFATTSITGNDINDVVAVGAFGDLVHFNGVGWKNDYTEPLLTNGSYTRVAMKGDLLVAVGGNYTSINSEAIILMGRR